MKIIRVILFFIIAVLATVILTSAVGTQLVLEDITGFGLAVSLSDRVSATIHDIIGLFPVLPILVCVSFLVAFLVAAVGKKFLGGNRRYWYMAAGLTSLPVALMIVQSTLGGMIYAAARTGFGMLLVALCGLFGGWLFARITKTGTAE